MISLVVCQNCKDGKHNDCKINNCRCAAYKHSDSLIVGVKIDKDKVIDVDEYNKDVQDVNNKINQEPKAFSNSNWDLVAEIIQSENYFVTFKENKEMWCYDKIEGIYKPYAHTIIEESCQRMIHKCQDKSVREIIKTIQRNQTMIDMKNLFESNYISTQNGILDDKTFEVKPPSPEYYTTSKLSFSINFEARNLKLWNHILTIIDVKDINLLMELIWICISNKNPFKKMFVFKGITNTQKTTLADIIVWIIGNENVSREKPKEFLGKNNRFSSSKFIGKRINIASEIGNLTEDMIENLKSHVGAEKQNTERKGDNAQRLFDPTRFVFLFTTNTLGEIYSKINDNSVITRFQFLIFRNEIEADKTNGQWYNEFFKDDADKQSAIDTIINIIIHYKKAQLQGMIQKTKWSNILETKTILDEEMPIENKYFKDERIIEKPGSKLTISEIRNDFEKFVGYKLNNQEMGNFMKKHGYISSQSNSVTIYKGLSFASDEDQDQTNLEVHNE